MRASTEPRPVDLGDAEPGVQPVAEVVASTEPRPVDLGDDFVLDKDNTLSPASTEPRPVDLGDHAERSTLVDGVELQRSPGP